MSWSIRIRSTSVLLHEADAVVRYYRNRTPDGEVLMATVTEDDFRAGKPVSDKACLRGDVARLPMGGWKTEFFFPAKLQIETDRELGACQ